MTDNEKIEILIQEMTCVGTYGHSLECISHDIGFSIDETLMLILKAICQGKPIRQKNGKYYWRKHNAVKRNNKTV